MSEIERYIGIDLKGFKIMPVYSAEIQHPLMGYFPLISIDPDGNDKIVYCCMKETFKKVMRMSDPNYFKVSAELMIVNIKKKVALFIGGNKQAELEITTMEDVNNRSYGKPTIYRWDPGLIGSQRPSVATYNRLIDDRLGAD